LSAPLLATTLEAGELGANLSHYYNTRSLVRSIQGVLLTHFKRYMPVDWSRKEYPRTLHAS